MDQGHRDSSAIVGHGPVAIRDIRSGVVAPQDFLPLEHGDGPSGDIDLADSRWCNHRGLSEAEPRRRVLRIGPEPGRRGWSLCFHHPARLEVEHCVKAPLGHVEDAEPRLGICPLRDDEATSEVIEVFDSHAGTVWQHGRPVRWRDTLVVGDLDSEVKGPSVVDDPKPSTPTAGLGHMLQAVLHPLESR